MVLLACVSGIAVLAVRLAEPVMRTSAATARSRPGRKTSAHSLECAMTNRHLTNQSLHMRMRSAAAIVSAISSGSALARHQDWDLSICRAL